MSAAEEAKIERETEFELSVLVSADLDRCLSCNACRADCRISNATDLLHPLKLLRMLSMGLVEEVIRIPEIWYCLQCNQCSFGCPTTVKPAALIRYLRREALRRQAVSLEKIEGYEALCAAFHRARYRLVAEAQSGVDLSDSPRFRKAWKSGPKGLVDSRAAVTALSDKRVELRSHLEELAGHRIALDACMTCNECATACPVAYEHTIFNPVSIFRMVHYGLVEELLRSPSIWLCLECQACTDACAQQVSGHLVFRSLQELAIRQELVPQDIRGRLRQLERVLYPVFLREIDDLLGVRSQVSREVELHNYAGEKYLDAVQILK